MRRLSILVAASLAMTATGVAAGPGPSRTLVLFGARWCAPCMGELADLPAIVAAAVPDRVALGWVDREIAARGTVPDDAVATLPAEEARRLADAIAGEGYGLPFAALLDAPGHACAVHRGPLRVDAVAAMRDACRVSELPLRTR